MSAQSGSYEGPILDFHAHIFPPQVAAKAVVSIGEFYELPMTGGGTSIDLLEQSRKAGITNSVIFSTATRIEQVASINRFMLRCQQSEPSFTAFGTLHPAMSDEAVDQEIAKILEYGLLGIKLHPDFQEVAADSPFVRHAARSMAGRLPLLLHAGDPRQDYSQPFRIRNLALACPETTLIAAHLGGWSQWPEAVPQLAGLPNVYVDTSSSLAFLPNEEAIRQIRSFDARQVLFGTDYPMWHPVDEKCRFLALDLTEDEHKAILWENGRALLGL
jgi:uncharacterized protein